MTGVVASFIRTANFSDFFSCSTNLPSKLSTTEKQWAIYHGGSKKIAWYHFDFILVFWG